jgi:small multidrug resistance family-3 protein
LFAYLLTLVDASNAGRAYAAYGAIYIAASIVWLRLVEKPMPDGADLIGASVCLVGAAIIMFGRSVFR